VASRTPLTTENLCGVNVPTNVPWPSALLKVPVTAEVSAPFCAAGLAAVAVFPRSVTGAALAVVANSPSAVASVAAVTAVRAIRRGFFMIYLPLGLLETGVN
jgi:hypothetical protein